jgi:hypothetical protein
MVRRNITRPKNRKPLVLAIIAAVVLVGGVLAALELTDATYLFHDRKAVSGVIPSKSDKKDSSENKNDNNNIEGNEQTPAPSQENPKQGDTPTSPPPAGAPPITPTGNFVSNHHPNLDGAPALSSVQSVCNTTAGAECFISFTNPAGIVKTLPVQKTDSNGATYWNWDVRQAGFTVGTWKIKITATLNGQTQSAEDVQSLEVGP